MYYIIIILLVIYLLVKNKQVMMVFQQNWYNKNNWYIHWLFKNKKQVFLTGDLFLILISLLYLINEVFIYFIPVMTLILIILEIKKNKGKIIKKPLVYTKRVKRLFITLILFNLIISLFVSDLTFLIFTISIYLSYFVIYIVNIINKPLEKIIFNYFRRKAVKKLTSMKHTEVIGITGSYGKTSSKNILNDILNIKYNCFPSPQNYNTEVGLILTINQYLDKFNDYFIAEMGASRVDEIATYCDLVKPKYGILTVIGKAHLESFKTVENIRKGKFSLIESLPEDGVGILNADDPLQVSYELKNTCKIIWIGINNKADIRATDIKCTDEGTSFNVVIAGEKHVFKTRLLGKNNVYNILAGIALGYHLGITVSKLQQAVLRVNSVEHRLQLIKKGDLTIIDDAYNSNPQGFKMALEVLDMMKGKKIIMTPGMVELGAEQYTLNKEAGINIADVCDEVILVGEKQTKPIQDGLKEKKYKNVHIVNSTNEGFELINKLKDKNTFVLLENDLPDIF